MRKALISCSVLAATTLALVWVLGEGPEPETTETEFNGADETPDEVAQAASGKNEIPATAREVRQPTKPAHAPDQSEPATPEQPVTPEEDQLLTLYAQIGDVLSDPDLDCGQAADSVDTLLDSREGKPFRGEDRVSKDARAERLRTALRAKLPNCTEELMPVLERLSGILSS